MFFCLFRTCLSVRAGGWTPSTASTCICIFCSKNYFFIILICIHDTGEFEKRVWEKLSSGISAIKTFFSPIVYTCKLYIFPKFRVLYILQHVIFNKPSFHSVYYIGTLPQFVAVKSFFFNNSLYQRHETWSLLYVIYITLTSSISQNATSICIMCIVCIIFTFVQLFHMMCDYSHVGHHYI